MKYTLSLLSMMVAFPAFSAEVNSNFTTKEQFIEKLTPAPQIKTRSIQLNSMANNNGDASEAPNVSMHINFAFDSFQLTEESKAKLKPLGEALMSEQLADYSFDLAGHTDAAGAEQYNEALSGKRAVSVGQYLYDSFGVAPERLKLSGHGETALLDSDNPRSSANRRVEITTIVNTAN